MKTNKLRLSIGWVPKFVAICLFGTYTLSTATGASAQTLHAPSRTLYKCKEQGKLTYSDSPCLGAEKLEVEPTRGVNKLSGEKRVGPDVRRELEREMFAEMVRPLTGMSNKQFEVEVRRVKLPWVAQQECRRLDQDLVTTENEEKRAAQNALRDVQARLFLMRQRFRELRC
ncbi:hypothetical protein AB4Z32_07730 [Massilia sp. 2TAF26]|uniref:hypothetical protein n=1 Tax=Massilia sp. 2TAF26 TaxID=3233012 RepID=UPI003F959D64